MPDHCQLPQITHNLTHNIIKLGFNFIKLNLPRKKNGLILFLLRFVSIQLSYPVGKSPSDIYRPKISFEATLTVAQKKDDASGKK